MADCGASGTALDRAAQALLGSSNQGQAASKQLSNLLGHASVASSAAVMPQTAPNQLMLPGAAGGLHHQQRQRQQQQHFSQMAKQAPHTEMQRPGDTFHPAMSGHMQGNFMAGMDEVWNAGPAMAMHPSGQPMLMQSHAALHAPMGANMMAQRQQQQQQYQMQQQHMIQMQMMQMQQHQQQQQQQQQQLMMEKQKLMQSQQSTTDAIESKPHAAMTASQADKALEDWHEGLEDEFGRQFQNKDYHQHYDDDVATVGHDGNIEGASIEQLAAAWAQAETEYDELSGYDDPNNMWNGQSLDDMQNPMDASPYKFVHVSEQPPSEMLDFMAEGMTHFREGDLKRAIHSFEMELQHKNPDNSTAWRMLGKCHAENDQDPEAIKCLEAAVDRDPYSTDALLALGVSYVNELNHEKALENLKAWITNNPKYAGMELPADIYGAQGTPTDARSAFDEVKHLLLTALDYDSTDAAEIHEALGVVYNVSKEFEAAAASLRRALDNRPEDYQLWNKLGATLANGNVSEDALPAYHKAIQLKPKYARAWLNMAISHSNLQSYDQAARCYLQALSLNPRATHCWSYLRVALSADERWDLLPLVFNQDLAGFREHFDFVLYNSGTE